MSYESGDNIHDLPNSNKKQLSQIKRLAPSVVEECAIFAEMRYANYLEHIKAGFTKQQALALCTKFGLTP